MRKLVIGLFISALGFAQKPIDPQDNIRLLWISSQTSMYEEAVRVNCAFAESGFKDQYTEGFKSSCRDDRKMRDLWVARREKLRRELTAKYKSGWFAVDEETGIARPQ